MASDPFDPLQDFTEAKGKGALGGSSDRSLV